MRVSQICFEKNAENIDFKDFWFTCFTISTNFKNLTATTTDEKKNEF